jgi:hypothetical protein
MSKCKQHSSKRIPCCVLDSDEMAMRSLCLEASEKYDGDGRVKLLNKCEKLIQGADHNS